MGRSHACVTDLLDASIRVYLVEEEKVDSQIKSLKKHIAVVNGELQVSFKCCIVYYVPQSGL